MPVPTWRGLDRVTAYGLLAADPLGPIAVSRTLARRRSQRLESAAYQGLLKMVRLGFERAASRV